MGNPAIITENGVRRQLTWGEGRMLTAITTIGIGGIQCRYNYNDERAVLYAFMWNGATMLKCYLGIVVGYRIPYVYIIL